MNVQNVLTNIGVEYAVCVHFQLKKNRSPAQFFQNVFSTEFYSYEKSRIYRIVRKNCEYI